MNKMKNKITLQEAERRYKKELADGTINTETTPHYDSFMEYCEMLRNMGYEIED